MRSSWTAATMWLGLAAAVPCIFTPASFAQATTGSAPVTKLEFDVASVKQNKSADQPNMNFPLGPGDVYVPNGGNFVASNLPLIVYINFAYKVTANQMQAIQKQLPAWVMSEKYDITAKTEKHDATKDEMRLMMRSLLAERFKLVVHSESQQTQVYRLVMAKPGTLGPKLRLHPASAVCSSDPLKPDADGKAADPASWTDSGGFSTICGGILGVPSKQPGTIAFGASNVGVGLLASTLTGVGKYDFVVEFAPERGPGPGDGANISLPLDSAGPSLEQAMKDQLGLKLESQRGSVDVWVVDHVEHPTAD
jgi:uncharacterized protein (TIGR03435 family)